MDYLEKIYKKAKADDHFSKFDTYELFRDYFKDESSYLKLHAFLSSKGYNVPNSEDFLSKIKDGSTINSASSDQLEKDIFNQPPSATGQLSFSQNHYKKLPDIIRVGSLGIPNSNSDMPALVPFSDKGGLSIAFSNDENKEKASQMLQLVAFRLLLSIPSKQSKFYIIDYEKSGASFVNLLGLDDKILEPVVWDDPVEISEGIARVKDQVPKIIAENLQSNYRNLAEYNEKIEHSNQPFQFLMIANFPKGFNQEAIEKTLNLIQNGNKAGVFILMTFDKSVSYDDNNTIKEIIEINPLLDLDSNKIFNSGNDPIYNQKFFVKSFDFQIPSVLNQLKAEINSDAQKQKVVKIDLSQSLGQQWSESAADGIKVPIGITESNDPIDFVLGLNSDSYHALIGGATGSGKSVLLHNIIVNSSLLYSPETLQLILLDYKEGTEFSVYEKLPHVKVLSVECEQGYGISVLDFLVNTISERGDLFKNVGAGHLDEYIRNSGDVIPRYVVIIDEFQVLLSGQGSISTKASRMIEDVTRRGRSFGVNLILATQSLADVDISTSTLGQLGLRIGMKMGEFDAMRILSSNNTVPVGFDRPGLAVYNTKGGDVTGNVLFQSAFISKTEISEKVNQLSERVKDYKPFKQFINNGKSHSTINNNSELDKKTWVVNNLFCDFYIGEPAYLQEEHYKLRLRKQVGSNVYIEGEMPENVISLYYHGFEQIIKQSSPDSQFYIFNFFDIDSGYQDQLDNLSQVFTNVKIYTKEKQLESCLEELKQVLASRIEADEAKSRICLGIINGQRIRSLKKDGFDDSLLSTILQEIIKDGPDYAIHTFLHFQNNSLLTDSFGQSSKLLNEFENLVLVKGSDIGNYVDHHEIKNEGDAYVKQPNSKNEVDLVRVYKKQ